MPDTCSLMYLIAVAVAPQVVDVFVSRLVYISYSSVMCDHICAGTIPMQRRDLRFKQTLLAFDCRFSAVGVCISINLRESVRYVCVCTYVHPICM